MDNPFEGATPAIKNAVLQSLAATLTTIYLERERAPAHQQLRAHVHMRTTRSVLRDLLDADAPSTPHHDEALHDQRP